MPLLVQDLTWDTDTKELLTLSMSSIVSAGFGRHLSVVGSGILLRPSGFPIFLPGRYLIE